MTSKLKTFDLQSSTGISMKFINHGGSVMELLVPDREGKFENVLLHLKSPSSYLEPHPCLGSLIGRFGNRIQKGFSIDDDYFALETNEGTNCLHSGENGIHHQYWEVEILSDTQAALSFMSENGSGGFPGNVQIQVTYTLHENDWIIDYKATTDQATVINLTAHPYFNLGGSIHDHHIFLKTNQFLALDENNIPTKDSPRPVMDSPFDFTKELRIGDRINTPHEQIELVKGYDHCFVRDALVTAQPEKIATVRYPENGRMMEVLTTEPGVQFFTANFEPAFVHKDGTQIEKHQAFCLETEHFPNSPNRPDFPNTELRPNEVFESRTIYRFKTD